MYAEQAHILLCYKQAAIPHIADIIHIMVYKVETAEPDTYQHNQHTISTMMHTSTSHMEEISVRSSIQMEAGVHRTA